MPSALTIALFLSATLAVFIRLADAVPVFSSMGELSETSGEEVQNVDVKSLLGDRHKWHLMAKDLHKDVKTLRDEQFQRDFRETMNMTAFEGVRISTPLLKSSDGCLSKNFSTERCLERIYSVLTWYKDNWNYIEKENLTSALVNDIKHSTKRLLEAINSQLQVRDGQVDQTSSTLPLVKSAWTRKTSVHSILFNFTNVMIDTCRAINYMSRRKAGHRGKDTKRPGDWSSSDKN